MRSTHTHFVPLLLVVPLFGLTACDSTATATQAATDQPSVTDEHSATDEASTPTEPAQDGDPTSPGEGVVAVLPDQVELQPNPDVDGVSNAPIAGDPSTEGSFSGLGLMEADAVFPAHAHPDDRFTTVLSGTMYYGVGEEFSAEDSLAYPVGSVVFTPAGVPHWMWAPDGDILLQETGAGPTGTEFFDDAAGE